MILYFRIPLEQGLRPCNQVLDYQSEQYFRIPLEQGLRQFMTYELVLLCEVF